MAAPPACGMASPPAFGTASPRAFGTASPPAFGGCCFGRERSRGDAPREKVIWLRHGRLWAALTSALGGN